MDRNQIALAGLLICTVLYIFLTIKELVTFSKSGKMNEVFISLCAISIALMWTFYLTK